MVEHGDLESPSFLLESVVNGDQQGRYSFVGAMPALEVVAKGHQVRVVCCVVLCVLCVGERAVGTPGVAGQQQDQEQKQEELTASTAVVVATLAEA